MDRVLLIRRGGLGDTLLTAPLLRALRRARPGAALHLAGTREYCDVLARYGLVDEARRRGLSTVSGLTGLAVL